MLAIPATMQMARSVLWSTEKPNSSLNDDMYSTAPSNTNAPPNTHHRAGLGVSRVSKIVLDQDRFMRISPRLENIRVVNVNVLASVSPKPLYSDTI